MKTQYYTAASLDGFIATPEHSLDWLFQFGDEPGGDYVTFIAEVGAIAMGAHTYEWLYRHAFAGDPAKPEPWPYPQPTWVFTSRQLPPMPGADLRLVSGDVRPVHRDMRAAAGGKNLWVVGGGELAGQFWDHGLLDELIVTIASVTLGAGAPLLPRMVARPPLRLLAVKQQGDAFVELTYAVPKPAAVTSAAAG